MIPRMDGISLHSKEMLSWQDLQAMLWTNLPLLVKQPIIPAVRELQPGIVSKCLTMLTCIILPVYYSGLPHRPAAMVISGQISTRSLKLFTTLILPLWILPALSDAAQLQS